MLRPRLEAPRMSLMSFIGKQFIDVLQWNEDGPGVLAWRYRMQDFEIQNGAALTVRETQRAMFVNEGKVADLFGPGNYTLTKRTLPALPSRQNWTSSSSPRSSRTCSSSASATKSTSAGAHRSPSP